MKIGWLITALLIFSVSAEAEIHPLSLLGDQQFANKQFELALISYNQLIQEFPDKKEGYFNRGLCLYATEKFSEAIFDFDECTGMDSSFSEAQLMKGFALEKRGDLKEAMAEYKNLQSRNTNRTLLDRRIKNYQLAVVVSKSWYYMIAIMLVVILLMAVIVKSIAYRKG